MKTALQVGERLVELCKAAKFREALVELYADDITSAEASGGSTEMPRVIKGKAAVTGKTDWWEANHQVHSVDVKGPFAHGDDQFAVIFKMDVTQKPTGQRFQMEEVAVYEVKDGKVSAERFYYTM